MIKLVQEYWTNIGPVQTKRSQLRRCPLQESSLDQQEACLYEPGKLLPSSVQIFRVRVSFLVHFQSLIWGSYTEILGGICENGV